MASRRPLLRKRVSNTRNRDQHGTDFGAFQGRRAQGGDLCGQGKKVIMRSIGVLGVALAVLCGLWNGSAMNQTDPDG